jgi:hypothetical protein
MPVKELANHQIVWPAMCNYVHSIGAFVKEFSFRLFTSYVCALIDMSTHVCCNLNQAFWLWSYSCRL